MRHFSWENVQNSPDFEQFFSQVASFFMISSKSNSSSAQYVPLQNIFFTSKFSYIGFCKPTYKTETGIANRWWTTNSKPPGPIIMMGQSETPSSSQIILITLFCAGAHRPCTFHKPPQTVQLCWAKTIFLSQAGMVWLFFIQIYCAGSHTEHPAGDALSR
jgi:hypothetical protein